MNFSRMGTVLAMSRPSFPLALASINRFNNRLAFSTLKDKAERYLCGVVTYRTLYDVDLKTLYSPKELQSNKGSGENLSKKTQKLSYEPYSLRERVIKNLNMLKLSSQNNREEVRKIFEIGKGLQFGSQNKPSRLILGAEEIRNTIDVKFVFNPTLLFRQLYDQIAKTQDLRKFVIGKFGIGKSSNQMLLSHLTYMFYMFRKEGKEAQAQFETLLKKNEQILRLIISLSQTETRKIQKKDNTFIQIVKRKFYDIPFVFFYNLPDNFQKNNIFGFQRTDFLKYFTEEQLRRFEIIEPTNSMTQQDIKKINLQNSRNFLELIQKSCLSNKIRCVLIIDQINLFYRFLRQKMKLGQILQKEAGMTREQLSNITQYSLITKNLELYSIILNQIHCIFTTSTKMILTASADVQYTSKQEVLGKFYRPHQYAKFFFNKQLQFNQRSLSYSQQFDKLLRSQMDIVFMFQFEKIIHRLTSQLDSVSMSNLIQDYKQKIAQVIRQLKYRYYKEMAQRTSQKDQWPVETRHLLITSNFKARNIFITLQTMFQSIIDFLIESGNLRSEQQLVTLKKNLSNKMFQKIIELKEMVNKRIQISYLNHLYLSQAKGPSIEFIYKKEMFFKRLFEKVSYMVEDKENQKQVIIKNEMLNEMLVKCNISIENNYSQLKQLLNKDYQKLVEIDGKIVLQNNFPLKKLKRILNQIAPRLSLRIFFLRLFKEDPKIQAQVVQMIVKDTFTTTQVHLKREGEGDSFEEFNIINQETGIFLSILSDDTIYKKQMNKFNKILELEKKISQMDKDLSLMKYIQNLKQLKSIIAQKNKIIQKKQDKWSESQIKKISKVSLEQISFLRYCKKKNVTEVNQETIRQWKKLQEIKTDSFEKYWKETLSMFSKNKYEENIEHETCGLRPINKKDAIKKKDSPNNPYFDLVLIKKLKKDSNKNEKYKFIFIDVTISKKKAQYKEKIKKIVDFKDLFILNNADFMEKIDLQFWHLCPADMAEPYRKQFQQIMINEQQVRDQINKTSSERLTYKVLAFEDLKVTSNKNWIAQQYNQIAKFVKILE